MLKVLPEGACQVIFENKQSDLLEIIKNTSPELRILSSGIQISKRLM